ncbi:prepilin-type N-terminal cleavage/methylation domain-containing protein [Campylobacter sp. Marseille-Q3452]|uniref:Prepilin-type N-terminal cleavage/methylation domain-containing protein n=1 Tax=Campylobacter massiliensis TaxID=2762557 RepID=A0A842J3K6_9BACT|nr:prepilin-type N-terminal cleavage/methylation domain-containing protein [Campylobacter massiliensis]MBC2882078.1 prepilin-type N-terminal cleavage/methylation domain-containing protein [Campylobacter massiliensis]
MRKGFTMIELIFVIVILGILAAVAIPRLSATRDDAEISKAATNYSTLISDLTAYYTSQGNFSTNWADMTQTTTDGTVKLIGETCVTVEYNDTAGTITATPTATGKCAKLFEIPAMKNVFGNTPAAKTYQVGGRSVKFN